jgi:hypothetical protein
MEALRLGPSPSEKTFKRPLDGGYCQELAVCKTHWRLQGRLPCEGKN